MCNILSGLYKKTFEKEEDNLYNNCIDSGVVLSKIFTIKHPFFSKCSKWSNLGVSELSINNLYCIFLIH